MQVRKGALGEYIALFAVFLSVVVMVLETMDEVVSLWGEELKWVGDALAVFFVAEFVVRLIATQLAGLSVRRAKGYALSFFGMVDFVSILPSILPVLVGSNLAVLKMFRILRVFRILKFGRYSKSVQMLGEVIVSVRYALMSTLFVSLFVILFSASSMYYLEHDVQPEQFPDIPATFWWAMATLTTVGYGDVYPVTALGKLFASLIALTGIGLVAIPTGILSAAFTRRIEGQE